MNLKINFLKNLLIIFLSFILILNVSHFIFNKISKYKNNQEKKITKCYEKFMFGEYKGFKIEVFVNESLYFDEPDDTAEAIYTIKIFNIKTNKEDVYEIKGDPDRYFLSNYEIMEKLENDCNFEEFMLYKSKKSNIRIYRMFLEDWKNSIANKQISNL